MKSSRRWLNSPAEWSGETYLSVLGPTGSGKTSSVLRLVRQRWPDQLRYPLLVSVDSVACYRGLDIGSAKPLGAERNDFDWLGLDFADPRDRVSASDFVDYLRTPLQAARAAGRPIILVGGSHFYERALVDGMSPGDPSDAAWLDSRRAFSNETIKSELVARDPRWETKVHLNDRYRLDRYSDLAVRQGLGYDELFGGQSAETHPGLGEVDCVAVGLEFEPDEIHARLAGRIQEMCDAGWVQEVQSLLAEGLAPDSPGLSTVGYREIVAWLKTGASVHELREQILRAHLQLAKKQRTWIRGLQRR